MELTKPAKSFQRACSIFLQDLRALPEDAFSNSFGPATRTVADIVFEVNRVNEDVATEIRGETPPPWPEGWITAPDDFQSKDVVVSGFEQSSNKILETINSFSQEELDAPLQTEGGTTTRADRCSFMTLHIWYHSGQLNFIQTLLGDDKWHWE